MSRGRSDSSRRDPTRHPTRACPGCNRRPIVRPDGRVEEYSACKFLWTSDGWTSHCTDCRRRTTLAWRKTPAGRLSMAKANRAFRRKRINLGYLESTAGEVVRKRYRSSLLGRLTYQLAYYRRRLEAATDDDRRAYYRDVIAELTERRDRIKEARRLSRGGTNARAQSAAG